MPTNAHQTTLTRSLHETLLALESAGCDGCLRLAGDGVTRSLYLSGGRLVAVDSSLESDALEWLLFAAGILTEEAHSRVRSRIAEGGRRGPALIEEGGVAPAVLCDWTARRARYLANEVLSRQGWSFRFHEQERPPDGAILADLEPAMLILEAVRGMRAEPGAGPGEILRPGPGASRLRALLQPHESYVLSLVNGERDSRAIAGLSELGREATLRCLAVLEAGGCLETSSAAPDTAATASAAARPATSTAGAEPDPFAALNLPRVGPNEPWGVELTGRLRAGIRAYNDLFVSLCGYLVMEVGPIAEQLLEKNLREVRDRHAAIFARVGSSRDGALSEEALLRNLNQMRDPTRGEQLLAGLESYLRAMVQAVKRILGGDHEQRVLRRLAEVRCGRG